MHVSDDQGVSTQSVPIQVRQQAGLPTFEEREMGWGQRFDVSDLFRISPYFTFEKSWHFLFFSILTVSLFLFRAPLNHAFGVPVWIEEIEFLIVRIKLFLTVCSLGYWEIYRRSCDVHVNGFRLEVIKGVWEREKITVHILPHTTLYIIRHSWLDYLLGTATLKIVPVNTEKPICIPFMPITQAEQTRRYLASQADKQLYVNLND
jgi:hypothetical protein